VQSGTTVSYDVLLDQFSTYQDLKDNGVSYSALTGLPIHDYSGNLNDGYAIGASGKNIMPLIPGGIRGTEVLDTTRIHLIAPGIATKDYADNSFSIELWVRPPKVSNSKVSILADSSNNVGLFWQDGDIIFQVGSSLIRYKVSNNKAHHVVGTFSGKSIGLFIDGALVDSLSLSAFKFSNSEVDFIIGPATTGDTFIVDSAAFYRYDMSLNKVINHFIEGSSEIPYSQIVYPENGELFSLNHEKIRSQFRINYPIIKPWNEIATADVLLASDDSYITFAKTDSAATASFSFEEEILIPSSLDIISSQLSYDDDIENIVVEVRIPDQPWVVCKNNSPLPYYNKNDNMFSQLLFLKVTISSSDTRTDLPRLKSLSIDMFANKDYYADNSSSIVSSASDYSLSRFNKNILSYDKNNGLSMIDGGGFDITTSLSPRSIEMIFYPDGLENVLFSSNSKIFGWDDLGAIERSGISAVYLNGVDITAETNILDFVSIGSPHHLVLVFSSAATSNIKINTNQDSTVYGMANSYSNIALYESALTLGDVLTHYAIYTGTLTSDVTMASVGISEADTGDSNTGFYLNELNWSTTSFN
jgi:hypothetical protein